MPIKLLPSPGRAVCNEVRAHYKSNTISELAGSLPLYFFFFSLLLYNYIQQGQGQTKSNHPDLRNNSPL